jgi:hypothetical protein
MGKHCCPVSAFDGMVFPGAPVSHKSMNGHLPLTIVLDNLNGDPGYPGLPYARQPMQRHSAPEGIASCHAAL